MGFTAPGKKTMNRMHLWHATILTMDPAMLQTSPLQFGNTIENSAATSADSMVTLGSDTDSKDCGRDLFRQGSKIASDASWMLESPWFRMCNQGFSPQLNPAVKFNPHVFHGHLQIPAPHSTR